MQNANNLGSILWAQVFVRGNIILKLYRLGTVSAHQAGPMCHHYLEMLSDCDKRWSAPTRPFVPTCVVWSWAHGCKTEWVSWVAPSIHIWLHTGMSVQPLLRPRLIHWIATREVSGYLLFSVSSKIHFYFCDFYMNIYDFIWKVCCHSLLRSLYSQITQMSFCLQLPLSKTVVDYPCHVKPCCTYVFMQRYCHTSWVKNASFLSYFQSAVDGFGVLLWSVVAGENKTLWKGKKKTLWKAVSNLAGDWHLEAEGKKNQNIKSILTSFMSIWQMVQNYTRMQGNCFRLI